MNRYTPIVVIAVAFLIAGSVAAQQDQTQQNPDSRIKSMLQEHEESTLGYVKSYEAFLPRFTQFAENHRGTEAEARATLWLIQQTWWLRKDGTMEETSFPLAKDLLKRHPASPQLGSLIEYKYVFKKEQRTELFNELIEVSPHRSVQAAAHFGLARSSPARNADGEPNPHYKTLLTEYADEPWRLSTFGTIANAYLNPHPTEALTVGKTAPEIVGVSHEGKPMHLSDYRGKVVLLDFWGHW